MIISGVIPIKSIVYQLVHEPSVDPFIEVRRLDTQKEKAQERRKTNNRPRHPVALRQTRLPTFKMIAQSRDSGGRFCWRAVFCAASTRCHAHSRNRWLRVHREQFYSVYLTTLQ